MRLVYALFIVSLVSIISADVFLSSPHLPAKLRPAAPPSTEPPKQVEVKAATPEDPGPIATVVSPLQTLMKTPADGQTTDKQEPAAGAGAMSAADHVDATVLPAPNHFLHQQFSVTDYTEFRFEILPHSANPTLRGSFRAFTGDNSESPGSSPASISLMVMNEAEFKDFVRGRSDDATYEAEPSSNQTVQFAMPHALDRAQSYHLVFRNSGKSRAILVKADFTISYQ